MVVLVTLVWGMLVAIVMLAIELMVVAAFVYLMSYGSLEFFALFGPR